MEAQLTAATSAISAQYDEQLAKQRHARGEEVTSLQKLLDAANMREAELQTARTALALEKNQLQLTITSQVEAQLTAATSAISAQYDEQLAKQRQAQGEEVTSLQKLLDAANAKELELDNQFKLRTLELQTREEALNQSRSVLEGDYLQKWQTKSSELIQQGQMLAQQKINLHLSEKNLQIDQLQRKIKDLEATAFQGSQQIQGEALEIEVEKRLRRLFPWDKLSPVKSGMSGADLIQSVVLTQGQVCGKIVWECKNTKNWNSDWLGKIKQNQHNENAQVSVIVSVALPEAVRSFDIVDGVWICSPEYFLELATAIRFFLQEVFQTRVTNQNKDIKSEHLFSYLTGQQFRARFTTIIESHRELREGLDKEKKAMTAAWSKREKQLELLFSGAASIYGDLSGILGKTIVRVEELEFDESQTDLSRSSQMKSSASQSALQTALEEQGLRPKPHFSIGGPK